MEQQGRVNKGKNYLSLKELLFYDDKPVLSFSYLKLDPGAYNIETVRPASSKNDVLGMTLKGSNSGKSGEALHCHYSQVHPELRGSLSHIWIKLTMYKQMSAGTFENNKVLVFLWFWFYGTSTIVGYLMPNPFLYI